MIKAVPITRETTQHILNEISYPEWQLKAFSRGDFYMVWTQEVSDDRSEMVNIVEVMTGDNFHKRYIYVEPVAKKRFSEVKDNKEEWVS